MSKLTITEALQEIKTIGKRLEKKRNSLGPYIVRTWREPNGEEAHKLKSQSYLIQSKTLKANKMLKILRLSDDSRDAARRSPQRSVPQMKAAAWSQTS